MLYFNRISDYHQANNNFFNFNTWNRQFFLQLSRIILLKWKHRSRAQDDLNKNIWKIIWKAILKLLKLLMVVIQRKKVWNQQLLCFYISFIFRTINLRATSLLRKSFFKIAKLALIFEKKCWTFSSKKWVL